MKKPLPAIAVFFIAFAISALIAQRAFPTNQETNALSMPDWYCVVVIFTCGGLAAFQSWRVKEYKRRRASPPVVKVHLRNEVPTAPVQQKPKANTLAIAADESEYIVQALKVILSTGNTGVGDVMRHLKIQYSRATKIIDVLEDCGIIGEFQGSVPREILVTDESTALAILEERGILPNAENSVPKQGDVRKEDINRDIQAAINEDEWRWMQTGLSRSEYELRKTDDMDGHVFETWCACILHKNKFTNVTVTKGSGDQGVDVLAEKGGIKYAIQCKCYSNDLSNKPVQEVNAGKMFYNCHVGVVMTNSHFTAGAKELAKATGVLLWDRDVLRGMLTASE